MAVDPLRHGTAPRPILQVGAAPRFVLKGALLLTLWTGEFHRPTRDLDLLGFGESSAEGLSEVFGRSAPGSPDDGLVFAADTVAIEPIREEQEYGGQRVKMGHGSGRARSISRSTSASGT